VVRETQMKHAEWVEELIAQLLSHQDIHLAIEGPDGEKYEISDCKFEGTRIRLEVEEVE